MLNLLLKRSAFSKEILFFTADSLRIHSVCLNIIPFLCTGEEFILKFLYVYQHTILNIKKMLRILLHQKIKKKPLKHLIYLKGFKSLFEHDMVKNLFVLKKNGILSAATVAQSCQVEFMWLEYYRYE